MSYRKYFKGHCQGCGNLTKLVLFERDDERQICRFRCSACSSLNEFQQKRVLKTGRVLTEKEFEKRKEALSEIQDYNPKNTYWRGQEIRHPVFDEIGKVVAKGQTVDDTKIITVNFEKRGRMKLVEGYRASA